MAAGMHNRKKGRTGTGSGKTGKEMRGKVQPGGPVIAGSSPGDAAFPGSLVPA